MIQNFRIMESKYIPFPLGMKNNQHISTQMTQMTRIIADFFNNLRKSVKSALSACHKTKINQP